MAKIPIYNADQLPSSQTGVPQLDNSGNILSQALMQSTSTLSSASIASAQQGAEYRNNAAYRSLTHLGQGLAQMRADQKRVEEAQDRIFQANENNVFETNYKLGLNEAEGAIREKYKGDTPGDSPMDRPKAFKESIDTRLENFKDANKIDDLRWAKIAPNLRDMEVQAYGRIDNVSRNEATEQAPMVWEKKAEALKRSGATIGASPADWANPIAIQNTLEAHENNRSTLLAMKPEFGMSIVKTDDMKTVYSAAMDAGLMSNIARYAPDKLDAVRSLPMFQGKFTATQLESQNNQRDGQINANRIAAERAQADLVVSDHGSLLNDHVLAGLKSTSPQDVQNYKTMLAGKIEIASANFSSTKDPMERERYQKQLLNLNQYSEQAKGWEKSNAVEARRQALEAKTAKNEAETLEFQKLQNDFNTRNAKAEQVLGSNEANAHNVALNALMRSVPERKLLVGDISPEDRANAKILLKDIQTNIQEGMNKGYFAKPGEPMPALIVARLGAVADLNSYLDSPKKQGQPGWIDPKAIGNVMAAITGGAPEKFHFAVGTQDDFRLRHITDEHVRGEVWNMMQKRQERIKNGDKMKDGNPYPPITRDTVKIWEAHAASDLFNQTKTPQTQYTGKVDYYEQVGKLIKGKQASVGVAPKGGKTTGGLVPPPIPFAPSIIQQEYVTPPNGMVPVFMTPAQQKKWQASQEQQ